MKANQIILLAFAVIAIGLFIIPSTMSMFVGQHSFFSVRTADAQYRMCERCHWDEVGEWEANTGAHATYREYYKSVEGGGVDPGCFCHQINSTRLAQFEFDVSNINNHSFEIWNESGSISSTNPASWEWRTNSTPHVAFTVACIDCHYNASTQLNNTAEAHGPFYNATLNATGIGVSENTACLACHTMVGLNITMQRNQGGLEIYANHTNYTAGNSWEIEIGINSTRTTNSTYWGANETR